MKRAGNLIEQIADWGNLRLAVAKALCGKRGKADALRYIAGIDQNVRRLGKQILDNAVPVGRFQQFTIFDPKERLISAPCFEERVLHHAIMNICEPIFERTLIYDSYACRKGKGRVACLQRAQRFARRFPYFLKLDIRKYFDSVDHSVLKQLLARRFKDRALLSLFERIIDCYAVSPGKGLPIGSLSSQHFANFYLGGCDRFITENRKSSAYVRYMDDMAIWGNSTANLLAMLPAIGGFLSERLKLDIKSMPYVNRTGCGMDFLGCRILPTHQLLNRRSRRRFRQKILAIQFDVEHGSASEGGAQRQLEALLAFTRTAGVKSWRFRQHAINQMLDDGHGLGSSAPGRQLEQQCQELPLGLSEQERAGQSEQQHRVPSGRSSNGD